MKNLTKEQNTTVNSFNKFLKAQIKLMDRDAIKMEAIMTNQSTLIRL